MLRSILTIAAILGFSVAVAADDKVPARPKADPKDTPLELTITGKTTKYTLDTGGLSPAEYKKKIEGAVGKGGKFGARPGVPPAVDLMLEIKNTSDKPVKVWDKGDPVVLTLELKGKGAVNGTVNGPMTLEFRIPNAVEIAPGKTHSIPIKSLASGMRGQTHVSYWTEPGEYELVAVLKTAMSPAPKGAKDAGDGFGVVTLTSPAFKVTVDEKKYTR
jgi:hypothetical protein